MALPTQAGSNGTWTNLAGGTWGAGSNWASGVIADGATFTADFSTLNITAPTIVTLDTARSIGTLKFQDATTANNNWSLAASGSVALTLDNGASQPIINLLNQTTTISAPFAGTNGFRRFGAGALILSNTSTGLSGPVSVEQGDITVQSNNAFGTGTITFNGTLGTGGNASTRLIPVAGVNIPNAITIAYGNVGAGNNGVLISNGAFDATFSGPITITNLANSGGHFAGSTGTNFLNFTNTITDTLAPNFVSGGTGNGIVVRSGNIRLSGGGSYFRLDERNGTLQLGANNGVATNAILNLGGNGNGILDLAGFNQSLVGVTNLIDNNAYFITNSSTTTASTLTLTPNPSNYSVVNFSTISFKGTISDASTSAPLNLVLNGDATSSVTLTGTASSYHGFTKLSAGSLAVASLNNGGSNSSIGAATNDAGNLLFDGGSLAYTGASASTDHNFTITAGKSAVISLPTASSTLTFTGASAATAGAFVKQGGGMLRLLGTNLHTGLTTVSGGNLTLNGSLGGGASIASGATLAGTGVVTGSVATVSGANLTPGDAGVGTLTVGGLSLVTGSITNLEFGTGNDQVTVTGSQGLSISGGNLNLYQTGTSTAFAVNGTYTLFNLTGGLAAGSSASNLTISNPVAGKFYNLVGSTTALTLGIGDATTREWNDATGDDKWTTTNNWIGGVIPNGVGQTAKFNNNLSNGFGIVDLNGNKTVSGVIFDNGFNNYDLVGTSSTLTLNNGVAAAAVSVLNGQHTIDVPVALAGATAISTVNSGDAVTFNGSITGAKAVTVTGPGTLSLNANNTFTTISISASTVNVGNGGSAGTLGSGAVTLSNAAILNFNNSANIPIGGAITGSGAITQNGSGSVSVAGSITGISTLSVNNGAVLATGSVQQSGGVAITGSGSLSVGNGLTGAGALAVGTSGTVTLTGASVFTGGTLITAGRVQLGASSSLATNGVLGISGGILDLHGNSISLSNINDGGVGGIITNDGAAASTSTIAFGGFQASYNSYASLRDGVNGGKVALTIAIANTASGVNYVYNIYGSSSYSGGTTLSSQSIEAFNNNALGTGLLTIPPNIASINYTHFLVVGGITLSNGVSYALPNAGVGNGGIAYDTATTGNSTISGPVTFLADPLSGGDITGPLATTTDYLNFNGPITLGGTATILNTRAGNVGFGGGGTYARLDLNGPARLNATNGIATSAVVGLGVQSINLAAGIDLNGYNQTLAGLFQPTLDTAKTFVTNSQSNTVTLTVNTAVANNLASNISGNINLVKSGVGSLALTGTTIAYVGNTTVTGGNLTIASPLLTPGNTLAASGATTVNLNAAGVAGTNVVVGNVASLAISGGAGVTVSAQVRSNVAQGVLIAGALSIDATSTLDLTNNDMIVHSGTGLGIGALVGAGRLKSSTAGTADPLATLGVIIDRDGQGGTLYPVFDGQPVTRDDVLVKYTYIGDTDLSGSVDGADLANLIAGMNGGLTGWINGDLDYNGVVNAADYNALLNSLANQGASFGGPAGATGAVPEPTTALLGLGLLPLMGRGISRRRR